MAITSFSGDHDFLSNFYMLSFTFKGHFAASSEHHFQAAKMVHFEDAQIVRAARTPGIAKKLGRQLRKRDDWDDIKLQVMEDILRVKFAHAVLRRQLALTGDEELVEGNWWNDTFWGVCKGVGENHLGKILMKIRAEIVSG